MNTTVSGSSRSPRGDPWQAFDALPRPIRDGMQEGVSPLCPLKVRRLFRALCREKGETEAIAALLKSIAVVQARAAGGAP
jgi:hypothetical protein